MFNLPHTKKKPIMIKKPLDVAAAREARKKEKAAAKQQKRAGKQDEVSREPEGGQ